MRGDVKRLQLGHVTCHHVGIAGQLIGELFDRSGHRAVLTPAGQLLLEQGRELLCQAETLEERVRRSGQGWETRLTIAVDEIIPLTGLFPLILQFDALRSGTLVLATGIFFALFIPFYLHNVRIKGGLTDLKGWRAVAKHTWGKKGIFRNITKPWFDWFKPGFHPWDHDNSEQLKNFDALLGDLLKEEAA